MSIEKQKIIQVCDGNSVLWNSGIIAHKDLYLQMCHGPDDFNVKNYVFLDKTTFKQVGKTGTFYSKKTGDFRLFTWRNRYWACFYSKECSYKSGIFIQEFFIADDLTITWAKKRVLLEPILDWPGYQKVRAEKNWMPFVHNEDLYFVYSVNPHIVLRYNEKLEKVERVSSVSVDMSKWPLGKWGFSGNANCVRVGEYYMGTFHSKPKRNYWTGYYFFDAFAPFKPTLLGTTPLFEPADCTEPRKSERVARAFDNVQFPVGLLNIGDSILVSYGVNDMLQNIASVSVKDLLSNTVPL